MWAGVNFMWAGMERLRSIFLVLVVNHAARCTSTSIPECIEGPSASYRGHANITITGSKCLKWNSIDSRPLFRSPNDDSNHSYCRNPDNRLTGVWCYSENKGKTVPSKCNVEKCRNDDLLLFASLTNGEEPASIWSLPADPELGFANLEEREVVKSYGPIWAMTADKMAQKIFYTETTSGQTNIEVLSLKSGNITSHFEGMGIGIEEMAFDWPTGNLYWTDSIRGNIVVADKNLKHYAIIYRNYNENLQGLAIHSLQRLVFFSFSNFLHKHSGIKSCDLTGSNVTTLYHIETNYYETSLTIDYVEERLYWVTSSDLGSSLMSCSFQGDELKSHFENRTDFFRGITTYQNSIFLSDEIPYLDHKQKFDYQIWVLRKEGNIHDYYNLSKQAKSLKTFASNPTYYNLSIGSTNPCHSNKNPCNHICVPGKRNELQCLCSFGYIKNGSTSCALGVLSDDVLLIRDSTQHLFFQIDLNKSDQNMQRLDIPCKLPYTVSALAMDVKRKILYWGDDEEGLIIRCDVSKKKEELFLHQVHVSHLAVDPETENLYFVDSIQDSIGVVKRTINNQSIVRTLYFPERSEDYMLVGGMVVDHVKKFVYWTTRSVRNDEEDRFPMGNLHRMDLDGSNHVVLSYNLVAPGTLALSHERNTLFITVSSRLIYEYDLGRINEAMGELPQAEHRYNLIEESIDDQIKTIQISGEFIYVGEVSGGRVQRVNLRTSLTDEVEGSRSFYKIGHFLVYNSSSLVESSLSRHECDLLLCEQFCFPRFNSPARCQCGDDWKLSWGKPSSCIEHHHDDKPPSFDACPKDKEVRYFQCSKKGISLPDWQEPHWYDDVTDSSDLKISKPNKTSIYKPGEYNFVYKATDTAGNTGFCSFKVRVVDETCADSPVFPSSNIVWGSPRCVHGLMAYPATCTNESLWVNFGTYRNKTFFNYCLSSLKWLATDPDELSCKEPPPESWAANDREDTNKKVSLTKNNGTLIADYDAFVTKQKNVSSSFHFPNRNKKTNRKHQTTSPWFVALIVITVISIVTIAVALIRRKWKSWKWETNRERNLSIIWRWAKERPLVVNYKQF